MRMSTRHRNPFVSQATWDCRTIPVDFSYDHCNYDGQRCPALFPPRTLIAAARPCASISSYPVPEVLCMSPSNRWDWGGRLTKGYRGAARRSERCGGAENRGDVQGAFWDRTLVLGPAPHSMRRTRPDSPPQQTLYEQCKQARGHSKDGLICG